MAEYNFEREIQCIMDLITALVGNEYTRIAIFDFDGTLFASPLPSSKLWTSQLRGLIASDLGWFTSLETLSKEGVSAEWFHDVITEKALDRINDPNTLAVLLTGRRRTFLSQIRYLCMTHSPPLNFNLFILREGWDPDGDVPLFESTLQFKMHAIDRLSVHFSNANRIEIYDDRKEHIDKFKDYFERRNVFVLISHECHHITIPFVRCLPEDIEIKLVQASLLKFNALLLERHQQVSKCKKTVGKVVPRFELVDVIDYTAVFLSENSQAIMQKLYPAPAGFIFVGNHVTICLGPLQTLMDKQIPKEQLEKLKSLDITPNSSIEATVRSNAAPLVLGSRVEFTATHFGLIDDQIQALKVNGITSSNEIPHITLSRHPLIPSFTSNSIESWMSIDHIKLEGIIQEHKVTGYKHHKPQVFKMSISLGTLVKEGFPELQGREIGEKVEMVKEWMKRENVENCEEERERIGEFVSMM